MQKGNRLALIALAGFGALAAGFGLALFLDGQAFASDAVGRTIQPPAMRADRTFSQTLVLPFVSSAGAPPTHTLVLPSVRSSIDETAKHKLVLPQVTQHPRSLERGYHALG